MGFSIGSSIGLSIRASLGLSWTLHGVSTGCSMGVSEASPWCFPLPRRVVRGIGMRLGDVFSDLSRPGLRRERGLVACQLVYIFSVLYVPHVE